MDRLRVARSNATGYASILSDFGSAVASSKAVIARPLGVIHSFVKQNSRFYVSFHKEVRSGARLPEDTERDRQRASVENTILPFIYEDINFAALTLDNRGLTHYGDYFVILKDREMSARASVFEENPFDFCIRQKVIAGTDPPKGFRAPWRSRGDLAMAKLCGKLSAATRRGDYPEVLMRPGTQPGINDEFVEVTLWPNSSKRYRMCIRAQTWSGKRPGIMERCRSRIE